MKRAFICALLCVALAASAPLLVAQTFQGGVRGSVRDADGAVIPGVVVTLVNEGTGVTRTAVTNERGEYVFAGVQPGTYTVRSELAGFRPFTRQGVTVGIQDFIVLDITLQVGGIEETVTVTGETPLIETATASVSSAIDKAQLEVLPTIGRNVFIFALTTPNVIHVGDPVFVRQQDQTNASLISLGGGPVRGNSYTLDGVTITDARNRAVINPNMEGVEEMKVQVFTYDAEMGRTGGGVFNTLHKSGANNWAGSFLFQGRPKWGRAKPFFTELAGDPKEDAPWKLFGGGIGGPIIRDKTFFYASSEGYKGTDLRNEVITLPTAAQAAGNFSGGPTIYDPLNIDPATGNRRPFPGNVIPADRIDPVGSELARLLTTLGSGDLSATATLDNIAWQVTGRVDHSVNENWQLSGTYMYYYSEEPANKYYADLAGGDPPPFDTGIVSLFRDVNVLAINSTHIPSDDSVLTFRYGWTQFNDDNRTPEPFDPTTLGFPADLVQQLGIDRFPKIYVDGYGDNDTTHGGWTTNDLKWWSQEISGTGSKFVGNHTLKFGGQFRRIGIDSFLPGYQLSFGFTRDFVSGPDPTSPTAGTGDALAALLLGLPDQNRSSAVIGAESAHFVDYYGGFVQDDWRVTPDLVMNFGLRLEHETGVAEKNNQMIVAFDRESAFPVQVPGVDLRGGVVYAGTGGVTEAGDPPAIKLGPRVGFAYSINPDTVLRGGYGLFWAPYFVGPGPGETTLATTGYTAITQYVSSFDGINPASAGSGSPGSLSNPFPGGLNQPVGNALGALTNAGGKVDFIDQFRKHPYIQRWSVDIQRELGGGVAAKVGYLGSKSTSLINGGTNDATVNINQLPVAELARGEALNEQVPNPMFGNPIFGAFADAETLPAGQFLRPFPQFQDVFAHQVSNGRARYDSVRAELEKRFRGNWGARINYTYTRQRDNIYESNLLLEDEEFTQFITAPGCVTGECSDELDFGTSRINAAHWVSLNGIYRLPSFEQGTAADYLLGGWSISVSSVLRSGFPMAIKQANNTLGSAYGFDHQRPNLTGTDPGVSGNTEDLVAAGQPVINPAAFELAPAFSPGNAPHTNSDARTPKLILWDIAFEKATPIGNSGADFTLRLEWVDVFNGVNWRGPRGQFGASNFGQITGTRGFPRTMQIIAGIRF